MNSQKFFICKHCGNLAGLVENKGTPLVCCGEKMTELVPNTVEASVEKHLPVVSISENTVSVEVGSVPHPMENSHHISFVYVEYENGGQRKCLKTGENQSLKFCICGDRPVAVYAYCNLHGLWRTEVE